MNKIVLLVSIVGLNIAMAGFAGDVDKENVENGALGNQWNIDAFAQLCDKLENIKIKHKDEFIDNLFVKRQRWEERISTWQNYLQNELSIRNELSWEQFKKISSICPLFQPVIYRNVSQESLERIIEGLISEKSTEERAAVLLDIGHALSEREDDIIWRRGSFEILKKNCMSDSYSGRKLAKLGHLFTDPSSF